MTLEERAILSNYIDLTPLDSEHRVWLVRDENTHTICVKKTVKCDSPSIYHRLQAAHITGIPEIYQIIEDGDNVILIEEYIHGATVEQHFAESEADDETIARFGIAICEILEQLHQLNPPIICRDIKPSNIMLTHGTYYMTDFNIARSYQVKMNEDTRLLGTAPYASPEQYGFGQTDAKSDIYSLGITMNVLRTGSLPKDKLANGKLGAVIKRATSIDPNDRYHDARSLKRALLGLVSRQVEEPRSDPGWARFKKPIHIIAWILYITWFIFLVQYDEPITVEGQQGSLTQEIASRVIFFLLVFLPYFYNSNYFGILDRTVGMYRDDKRRYWINRILFTLLISVGIPFIIALIFI